MNAVFVVGNKFREFGANEGVLTIGELEDLVKRGELGSLPADLMLVAGQGLREADVLRLREISQRVKTQGSPVCAHPLLGRPVRAGRLLTHKYQLQNSIISSPDKLDDDLYEAALLLDERSELMGDHQTGQHIQGMVLVEAARQMFLAVTEQYFVGYEDPNRYYFVINGLDVSFTGFVFPVEASLRYEILEKKIDNRARMFFKTEVSIMQAGKCVTKVRFDFTAFLAEKIELKEKEQAIAVLDKVRKDLIPTVHAKPLREADGVVS